MAAPDPFQSWTSSNRGSNAMMTGDSNALDNASFMNKFKSQYSHYNDLRGSFGSQLFSSQMDSKASSSGASGKPTYVLNLHFLGLSGLPKAGWFERTPGYELIVHAGGVAKRIRPRIPAPPPGVGAEAVDLQDFVPAEQLAVLQRIDDRASIRCPTPGDFFRVDVWEERAPLFDFSASKGSTRVMLGQCYVPLEHKYNRRPCTWPIVCRVDKVSTEVGFLTCKFGLATMPGAVQNLRVVEGTVGSTEMQLAWEPPESDGGTVLRGYRVEARGGSQNLPSLLAGLTSGDETPRTASAPAVAEPSAVLRNLTGNTEYAFCVWAVSEAGPGAGSEVCGKTGAVAPGVCGQPYLAESSEGLFVQWSPPDENGGADVIAYRVWLRGLFHDSAGEVWPAESWVDLGLVEHRGDNNEPQQTPLRLEAMQGCPGCLCSVSALNTAGLLGSSTPEVPIILPQSPQALAIPRPPAAMQAAGHTFSSTSTATVAPAQPAPSQQYQAEPAPARQAAPAAQADPLAQWHSPGALAAHQAACNTVPAGALAAHQVGGQSGDSGAAVGSQFSGCSPTPAQRKQVVDLDHFVESRGLQRSGAVQVNAAGNGPVVSNASPQPREQARFRSDGAASSGSSPGARSGSSPGGPEVAVAAQGGGAIRAQGQAAARVVEPSEIRSAEQSQGTALSETRVVSDAPRRATSRDRAPPTQAYYQDAALLQTEGGEAINNIAALRHLVPSQAAAAPTVAALRQDSAQGSWGLGQKGSLSAGQPSSSFELR